MRIRIRMKTLRMVKMMIRTHLMMHLVLLTPLVILHDSESASAVAKEPASTRMVMGTMHRMRRHQRKAFVPVTLPTPMTTPTLMPILMTSLMRTHARKRVRKRRARQKHHGCSPLVHHCHLASPVLVSVRGRQRFGSVAGYNCRWICWRCRCRCYWQVLAPKHGWRSLFRCHCYCYHQTP